jgi:uncharacterized membrane protein
MTTTPVVDAASTQPGFARGALFSLIGLIALSIAWELWLAPLRPGGSALALKAIPLLFALRGTFRRDVYTLQWASMLLLRYDGQRIVSTPWLARSAARPCVLRLRAWLCRAVQTRCTRREASKSRDRCDSLSARLNTRRKSFVARNSPRERDLCHQARIRPARRYAILCHLSSTPPPFRNS